VNHTQQLAWIKLRETQRQRDRLQQQYDAIEQRVARADSALERLPALYTRSYHGNNQGAMPLAPFEGIGMILGPRQRELERAIPCLAYETKGEPMSRPFQLVVVAALCVVPGCSGTGENADDFGRCGGIDYQRVADQTAWVWSNRKNNLMRCIALHLDDFQTSVDCDDQSRPWPGQSLTVRVRDQGKEVFAFHGHWRTVFTRAGGTLYIAHFSPIRTGCEVDAIDIRTGEKLWHSKVHGLGPMAHSNYWNQVSISTDGPVIIVHGDEAAGRYIEFLHRGSGRILANRVYK
jgi:hypothetical protein